jgi:hypothetical protein
MYCSVTFIQIFTQEKRKKEKKTVLEIENKKKSKWDSFLD